MTGAAGCETADVAGFTAIVWCADPVSATTAPTLRTTAAGAGLLGAAAATPTSGATLAEPATKAASTS